MRPQGKKKISTHVVGHQECGLCHPPQKNLKARHRAETKKEISMTDPNITLDKWSVEQQTRVARFHRYWYEANAKDPKSYPKYMSNDDWDEQYRAWLDSGGEALATNKEEVAENLRRSGIEFEETSDHITFKTKNWITDYHFRPDGSLEYIGQGNLAAVQKLELYDEDKKT